MTDLPERPQAYVDAIRDALLSFYEARHRAALEDGQTVRQIGTNPRVTAFVAVMEVANDEGYVSMLTIPVEAYDLMRDHDRMGSLLRAALEEAEDHGAGSPNGR